MENDTIAAIATAPGTAAISIVRLSGPDALVIADAVSAGGRHIPSQLAGGRFVHGTVRSPEAEDDGGDADEVILLVYRAPYSYTREDVVEFQGHGGRFASQRILRAVLAAGARPAAAGEFTRRAFLSGRVDLVQSEAVMDLIAAQSDRAAHAAVEQLEGRLSSSLRDVYDVFLCASADLEALLDFSDDEVSATVTTPLAKGMETASRLIDRLLETWHQGRLLREGALAVICGEPNAGKSTLMNALLRTDRAIVTDVPGTTRDTIEETITIAGIPLRLVDTAGLRDASSRIEREGVQRSRDMIARADVILYVLDASRSVSDADSKNLASLSPSRVVLLLNKSDLGDRAADPSQFPGHTPVRTALRTGTGIPDVEHAIIGRLGIAADSDVQVAISDRHQHLLRQARNHLSAADHELEDGWQNIAPAAMFLRAATESVAEIIGASYNADLLDQVFQRFCIGK